MRHATAPPTGKIASMASRFQEGGMKVEAREVARKEAPSTRHSFPGTYRSPAPTGLAAQEKKVKVHRTESHHERFTSARALFERIGSGDNLLEETSRGTSRVTSPAGSRTSSISHRPG